MVPITLYHKRIERPKLSHAVLLQRVGHVYEGVFSAWAYIADPITVDVLNSLACFFEIIFHELSALRLGKTFLS